MIVLHPSHLRHINRPDSQLLHLFIIVISEMALFSGSSSVILVFPQREKVML